METEILHRIQFAFSITFHYIYPPLSIGLSLALILFEGMYLFTKDPKWARVTQFWIRVFGLTFALGVATGIPLMFSFGTNWARYSQFIGDVLGSALAAEGLFAFGIEAGALGVVLFGWNRISKKLHFAATCAVSFGAHFSGIWITAVNSWMQTPAGYVIQKNAQGVECAVVSSWVDAVFNPSTASHLAHVILGAWLSGAFLIISVCSYYLLKNRHKTFAIASMKVAAIIAIVSTFLQFASADHLGRIIAKYNPVKMAAFEGIFTTEPYTKIYAFGYVDTENKKVYGLPIPGLLSFLIHRDFSTPVAGLDQADESEWPWVAAVFQIYHIMVAMAGLIFVAACVPLWMWKKKRWLAPSVIMKFLIASVAFPQIANIAGWYSSCMGRQPWIVHKLMKTKDAYSENVSNLEAGTSLFLFIVVYLTFFALFCILLDKKIKHGPDESSEEAPYRDPFKQH